jgi:hypothetical protein
MSYASDPNSNGEPIGNGSTSQQSVPGPLTNVIQAKRRQKGRNAPLPEYYFKNADVTVKIKRLGPFTMDEIRKSLMKQRQPPTVPILEVEVGEARTKMKEQNPHDPEYIRQSIEYNEWLNTTVAEKMLDLMVNYCIVCDIDDDAKEEIADRRLALDIIDPDISKQFTDRQVYVQFVLMSSVEDMTNVQQFILGQSMPTPEAVESHIESFPGEVQGETPVRTPGTAIGV